MPPTTEAQRSRTRTETIPGAVRYVVALEKPTANATGRILKDELRARAATDLAHS